MQNSVSFSLFFPFFFTYANSKKREILFIVSKGCGREKVGYAFILWKGTKEKRNRDLGEEMGVIEQQSRFGISMEGRIRKAEKIRDFSFIHLGTEIYVRNE